MFSHKIGPFVPAPVSLLCSRLTEFLSPGEDSTLCYEREAAAMQLLSILPPPSEGESKSGKSSYISRNF